MAQSNRLTKAERREQARKEAERLRKTPEAKETRSRRTLLVALIAAAAIVIYRQANKTVLSDFEGPTPVAATEHGGIPFGAEGAGTRNEGAPELDLYVDFMCPACGQFEQVNGEDIATAVANGE